MEKYENLGVVGEGSYGTVMKCRHKESGCIVAIKKFSDKEDKTLRKIIKREIKLLRQCYHENLVNMLDVFKQRRRLFAVFEFIDYTVLGVLEKNPRGLDGKRLRRYIFQILRAVGYLHANNIIHRDIKPENVLVFNSGVVKLCDFGFARTLALAGDPLTDYVATRWYRAPELLVGDKMYGKPVDVWAVGCLIIEMASGEAFLPGASDLDQVHQIVSKVGPLTQLQLDLYFQNPIFSVACLPEVHLPREPRNKYHILNPLLAELVDTCLQIDPANRSNCSWMLEHRYFTKDQFPERFIPEIQALIQKDATANNMQAWHHYSVWDWQDNQSGAPTCKSHLPKGHYMDSYRSSLTTTSTTLDLEKDRRAAKDETKLEQRQSRAGRKPERTSPVPIDRTGASIPDVPTGNPFTPATLTMPVIHASNSNILSSGAPSQEANRGHSRVEKVRRWPSPIDLAMGNNVLYDSNVQSDCYGQQVEMSTLAKKKSRPSREVRFPGIPGHGHQMALKSSGAKPAKHLRKKQKKGDDSCSQIPTLVPFDSTDQGK